MIIDNNQKINKEILNKYFPDDAINMLVDYIKRLNICLKITRSRKCKLGDYRPPPVKGGIHKITINGDLNCYAALLVFLHELSHLYVWEKYKNNVKPHGKQWKEIFGDLVGKFIDMNVFPYVLKKVLEKNKFNFKASFISDSELFRTLTFFDNDNEKTKTVYLEDIPPKTKFISHNGKIFIKLNKLRKRFRCISLDNQRVYLFNPLARIKPVAEQLYLDFE